MIQKPLFSMERGMTFASKMKINNDRKLMAWRLKYIILLVVFGLPGLFCAAVAQQQGSGKFFIYIQNENGGPFYVREKNNTVLSSSHAGYMIIPQLAKGSYMLTIGLPGDQAAEAAFEVHLNGDGDKGLLLREGNGQLALYSLKDFKEIPPIAIASSPGNRIVNIPAVSSPAVSEQLPAQQQPAPSLSVNQAETDVAPTKDTGETDAFSRMLNKIMGTTTPASTARNQPAAAPDSAQFTMGQNSHAATASPPVQSNLADSTQITLNNDQAAANPGTVKGADFNNTVTTNITNNPPSPKQNDGLQFINFLPDSSKGTLTPRTQTITKKAAPPADSPMPAVIPSSVNNDHDTVSQMVMSNSDCRQLAGEDFFQKIRRKMASRSDDESMFRLAQKYFSGGTCFSTQQIQSLTYLFMTDEYKYKFLELAYPHTYDGNHFSSLIKVLGNDYYRGRFKAMVRQANIN